MSEKRAWWKEAVIYQIYPRSFADSNGDGIGDLNGITNHLDYLKELGVDVLWLSPIYQSPNDDNGYDISDYQDIMTEFGTLEDFDRMLKGIHERGMKLMMDLVVNHSSDEHRWFVESRKSKDNPYRDYYIWRDPKNIGEAQDDNKEGLPPNNWGSCFSGPAWKYDSETGQYYLHLFSTKQPDLNWDNPKVRDEVFNMMNWWGDRGVDGFRMDVISMISKVPGLPDGKMNGGALFGEWGPYVLHGPHVHEYLQEMNRRVLSKHDMITVGETSGVTLSEAKKYAGFDRNELNMVFQFEQCDITQSDIGGKWSLDKPKMPDLRAVLNKWQTGLEGEAWNSLYLCNHDQPRTVSRYGNDSSQWRELSAKMLATMLHMMKGSVYVYEGEELGMTNVYFKRLAQYRDIETINAYKEYMGEEAFATNLEVEIECGQDVDVESLRGEISHRSLMYRFGKMGRDNARTPMQWDSSVNAGFTVGTPWIEINPNYKEVNAAAQTNDPDSVFSYFKKLIKLRHENPIIVYGQFHEMLMDSEEIYAYSRTFENQKLVVACNFTDREVECDLFETEATEMISNYKNHVKGKLQPYEARVILCSE